MTQDGAVEGSSSAELKRFDRERSALLVALIELHDIAERSGANDLKYHLLRALARLKDDRFTLVVLGEFKRGKSTLINALLGADVMPVGVVPLTSQPVTVEYAPHIGCEVLYRSGERRRIAIDEIDQLATERGNPGNRLRVDSIRVFSPAEVLRRGVVLVDTPGVGSVYTQNSEVTYRYLPGADAAIFMLSADTPATETEISFLRRVHAELHAVFYVLNKADLLSAEELGESLTFVSGVLNEVLESDEVKVHAISARYQDAGFVNFRHALERSLVESRGSLILDRARDRGARGLRELLVALDVQERALDLSADQLRERRSQLRAGAARLQSQMEDAEALLEADVRQVLAGLHASLDELRSLRTLEVSQAIREGATGERKSFRHSLEETLRSQLKSVIGTDLSELESGVVGRLEAISVRHSTEATRIATAVLELSSQVFEVDLAPLAPIEVSLPPSHFSFKLEDQLTGLEVARLALRGLLPGPIRRRLMLRDALTLAREMIDRHCGRISYDLSERVRQQEFDLRSQLRSAYTSSFATVEAAADLAESQLRSGEASRRIAREELTQRRRELEQIEIRLRRPRACQL